MFEQIGRYQPEAAALLARQIASQVLPQALLFSGPRFSGRMTLAMETARALSCTEDRSERCRCASCRLFASYGMSNVIALGNRDHGTRIEAALQLLEDRPDERTRLLVLRTVRLMLLQFHGALLDARESKTAAIFDLAASVAEQLFACEHAELHQLPEMVNQLRNDLKPLSGYYLRSAPLTIGQVRSLQEWTSQTGFSSQMRVILLEGIEQSTESSRNSLLKLLEEPPEHTVIIVISENPARLLPTILSRLQRHTIPALSQEATRSLIATLSSVDRQSIGSLQQFMLEQARVPCADIRRHAQLFADRLLSHQDLERTELDEITADVDEAVRLEYFLDQFQQRIHHRFANGGCESAYAARLLSTAGSAAREAHVFNQNRKLLVERLYYRLQEVL